MPRGAVRRRELDDVASRSSARPHNLGTGLELEGAAALATAIPRCPRLERVFAYGCDLLWRSKVALRAAGCPPSPDRPAGLGVAT